MPEHVLPDSPRPVPDSIPQPRPAGQTLGLSASRAQTIGLALIVVGLAAFVSRSFGLQLSELGWPLFVLLPGLLLFAGLLRGAAGAKLAVPASVVTMVGLILFLQNLTGRFETWSYAWALIPVAAGFGQSLQAGMTGDEALARTGKQVLVTGLGLFAAFGLFFEVLIFGTWGQGVTGRLLLPLALVGAGLYLLARREARP